MNHDEFIARAKKQLVDVAQKSAFYSADRVPKRTRKYSGQARASTNMAIGGPDTSVVLAANYEQNAIQGELGLATAKFKSVSSQIRLGDMVYVTNSLDYIRVVEYKYGDMMFTHAIKSWGTDVARAVNESR